MGTLKLKTTGNSPATPVAPFVGLTETMTGWASAVASMAQATNQPEANRRPAE